MDSKQQLIHFITAENVDCHNCKHFDEKSWDCRHPSGAHKVTNKLDFGHHYLFPIASAVRAYGGKCKPEGKLFE